MATRTESDSLGPVAVPADALYGAATVRAIANFPLAGRPVHRELVRAFGLVKLACAETNHELGRWDEPNFDAIARACRELAEGRLDEHVVVDALQGGAGTSTNLNVNEVLTNRALQLLGRPLGDYDVLRPLDDLNRHQSTNDVYPTALRVAAIGSLRRLERSLVRLCDACQAKEREFDSVVKLARTELQDAVPITLGRTFSAFAEAFARDRWRVSKCEERLRVVPLGGTAVGTALGAPRRYVFRVVERLRALTGYGLARSENLIDAVQNADALVETSGILKTLAVNLFKISNDLRLLASGPDAGLGELRLPPLQTGSSLMPGKVNPVIPEAVAQAALEAIARDGALTAALGASNLELPQFLPLAADALLTMLDLLERACRLLAEKCVVGVEADRARCAAHLDGSTATLTALVRRIGYGGAEQVRTAMRATGRSCRECVVAAGLLTEAEYDALLAPEAVLRLGEPEE